MGVLNDAGRGCNEEEDIVAVAENYFKTLFTTAHVDDANMELVLEYVDRRTRFYYNLTLRVRLNELSFRCIHQNHQVLMVCPLFFFQKHCHIVGFDVTEAILSVLNLGHMLHKMNFTHIMLIPKKKKKMIPNTFWSSSPSAWAM